jgi:hypothetical protein
VGHHQLLLCADNANLLGVNKNAIKKNTEAELDARKEIDIEVYTDKFSRPVCALSTSAR